MVGGLYSLRGSGLLRGAPPDMLGPVVGRVSPEWAKKGQEQPRGEKGQGSRF